MSKEVNTVIGKTVGYLGDFYIVDKGEEETRLTKEEFETVKLPELSQREQKYYDEIKESEKGDKRKMVSDVVADVTNGDCAFAYMDDYKIIEAIIKGGYND